MTVFPGGAVDPRDADAAVGWVGPPPARAGPRRSTPTRRWPARCCARPYGRRSRSPACCWPARPRTRSRHRRPGHWEADRVGLERRDFSLAELLARRGLLLRADLLRPWAHWITPPRRASAAGTTPASSWPRCRPASDPGRHLRGRRGRVGAAGGRAGPAAPRRAADDAADDRHARPARAGSPTWRRALAGSPPDPLEPISPTFEETPDGKWAVLPDGTRIRLVVPLPS